MGIVCLFTPMVVGAALTGSLFGTLLVEQVGRARRSWLIFLALAASSMFGAFEMVLARRAHAAPLVGRRRRLRRRVRPRPGERPSSPRPAPARCSPASCSGSARRRTSCSAASWAPPSRSASGCPSGWWATFAVSLPKGGKWMVGIKSIFGDRDARVRAPPRSRSSRPCATWHALTWRSWRSPRASRSSASLMGAVHLDWSDGGLGDQGAQGHGHRAGGRGPGAVLDELGAAQRGAAADPNVIALTVGALRGGRLRAGQGREAAAAGRLHRGLVRALAKRSRSTRSRIPA